MFHVKLQGCTFDFRIPPFPLPVGPAPAGGKSPARCSSWAATFSRFWDVFEWSVGRVENSITQLGKKNTPVGYV